MKKNARGKAYKLSKNQLSDEIALVLALKTGAIGTRKARRYRLKLFAKFIKEKFSLVSLTQVTTTHLEAYCSTLWEDDLGVASCQNAFTHIRFALRKVGRGDLVIHPHTSNDSLGIGGRKRIGVRDPIDFAQMCAFRRLAEAEDPGVAIMIALCFYVGLRAEEALMCARSLTEWERALTLNPPGDLIVTHGTKGGRIRTAPAPEPDETLRVVRQAREHAVAHRGVLIEGELSQARTRFYAVIKKIGMTGRASPHALRYSYANRYLEKLVIGGVSEDNALRFVANALGHGHGRKTWAKSYYCAHVLARGMLAHQTLGATMGPPK